ncbi:alpha/beta hydrolase fold domain-containing protein [Streptomyces sp. WM6378]|uniref:alpha/beta hydrolase fold domain-containing protein n=1 Tax=Streptomyces sp. WM6378 TaxID=1415557 RepID=UPI00099D2D44|nr:alpha/beta hydrolase fold domain-containing protein [Streptomyces sp. WM6378]
MSERGRRRRHRTVDRVVWILEAAAPCRGSGTPTPPTEPMRHDPHTAPLWASDRQLTGLPPVLVITAEADVLRDEGEAYAERLRRNGTRVSAVPYPGIPSDFLSRSNLYASHAAHRGIHRVIIYLAAGRASPRQPPPIVSPGRRPARTGISSISRQRMPACPSVPDPAASRSARYRVLWRRPSSLTTWCRRHL